MLHCKRCEREINMDNGYIMVWKLDKNIHEIRFACSKKCISNSRYMCVKFEGVQDLRLKLKELLLKYEFTNINEEEYVKSLIYRIWKNDELNDELSYLVKPKNGNEWCYVCDKYVDSYKEKLSESDYDERFRYRCIHCNSRLKEDNIYKNLKITHE